MQNTNLIDDIGAAIGTTATLRLLAVFGGTRLYIPEDIDAEHVIARAIGLPAAQRLAEAFAREQIELNDAEEFHRLQRVRRVAGLLRAGTPPRDVAMLVGVSTKQVARYRGEAEEMGLIPMVLNQSSRRCIWEGNVAQRERDINVLVDILTSAD